MAPSRPANEPLRLRGTPGQLTGFVPLPQLSEVPLPVDLEFANIAQPEVTLQETEGAARLTLSLAHTTPPGTYEGKVRVGDQEHPLILEVEPRVRLRVDPRRLHFEAAPGATREADLLVTNGDPLEVRTKVEHVYIKGKEIELSNKQTRLYDKYMGRP